MSYSEEELAVCLRVLQARAHDPIQIQERKRFKAQPELTQATSGGRSSLGRERLARNLELAVTYHQRLFPRFDQAPLIPLEPPNGRSSCSICQQHSRRSYKLHHYAFCVSPAAIGPLLRSAKLVEWRDQASPMELYVNQHQTAALDTHVYNAAQSDKSSSVIEQQWPEWPRQFLPLDFASSPDLLESAISDRSISAQQEPVVSPSTCDNGAQFFDQRHDTRWKQRFKSLSR